MIQFETVLEHVGEIGAAQVILLCLYAYFNIPAGFNALATVFIAYTPDMRCKVPPLDNATAFPNLTEAGILNLTTPYTKGSYDGCYRYDQNLESCALNLTCINQTNGLIACDRGYHYDTTVLTETVVTEFDLVCDNKYLNTLATSLYYLGMLIGSFAFGNFADAFGRKLCCVITFTGCLACMFGLSFSHSVAVYMVLRVGIAAFAYGSTLGTFVYIMEVTGEKWRTTFGICYQIAFPLGYMILGGVAYNWRNWHDIMLVVTLLSLPFLIFALMIPESPRWLFAKSKTKAGIKVSKLMARINRKNIPENFWEKVVDEKDQKEVSTKKHTFIDLFRDKKTLLITLNVMFNWFVNSLVYYGVSLNAGALAGDLYLNNTLNGVMEITSFIICLLLLDRLGRRIMLSALLFVAGIGLLASVIVNEYAGNNQSILTFTESICYFSLHHKQRCKTNKSFDLL
ncbi:unnamed protein product [Clavelina lepadiformis]|uniref:Major facilitator superfamily (MFS) profile domain-containing protein n=1 Tax=Clavelina lepadiformis TaxID=159417 RepID=A0ABP0F941_CLALP